jgi:hypothetical protein
MLCRENIQSLSLFEFQTRIPDEDKCKQYLII